MTKNDDNDNDDEHAWVAMTCWIRKMDCANSAWEYLQNELLLLKALQMMTMTSSSSSLFSSLQLSQLEAPCLEVLNLCYFQERCPERGAVVARVVVDTVCDTPACRKVAMKVYCHCHH